MTEDEDGAERAPESTRTSASADEPRTCANCGDTIDMDDWHPVTTGTDADGNFRVYAFCSRDCREAWEGENDPT